MKNNLIKIIIQLSFFTALLSCELGYIDINGNCYYQKDLSFLQALINNSQFNKSGPPPNLKPLELGKQTWENGRLITFCSSPASTGACKVDYILSGKIPLEIESLTEIKSISLESNALIGALPRQIKS